MKSLKSYNENVFQPAERRLKNFTISFLVCNHNKTQAPCLPFPSLSPASKCPPPEPANGFGGALLAPRRRKTTLQLPWL